MAHRGNNDVEAFLPRVPAATAERSPLHARLVLLSGGELALRAARTALAACAGVRVAPVPTRIFEEGCTRLAGSWTIGRLPGPSEGQGLSAVFDAPTMVQELRAVSDALLGDVRGDADVLVDEAPREVAGLQLAALLYPDACFVHVHWTRDESGKTATARSAVADSGVLHVPLSIDALLDAPETALEPVVTRVDAGRPRTAIVRRRLELLVSEAPDRVEPRVWARRTVRRLVPARKRVR